MSYNLCFKDNINNEEVWAEISSQEQNNQLLLEDEFSLHYFGEEAGPSSYNASQLSAREFTEAVDDPKFVYSKVSDYYFYYNQGNLLFSFTVYEIYETGR